MNVIFTEIVTLSEELTSRKKYFTVCPYKSNVSLKTTNA